MSIYIYIIIIIMFMMSEFKCSIGNNVFAPGDAFFFLAPLFCSLPQRAPHGMDVLVVLEKFHGDVVGIKCLGYLCSGPKGW